MFVCIIRFFCLKNPIFNDSTAWNFKLYSLMWSLKFSIPIHRNHTCRVVILSNIRLYGACRKMPFPWTYTLLLLHPVNMLLIWCVSYFSIAAARHHTTYRRKGLCWACGSKGIRVHDHHNGEGRHGNWTTSRKKREQTDSSTS